MDSLDNLKQEFDKLKTSPDYSNRPRLREIYNIFSKQVSELFKSLNEFDNNLCQSSEITHENLIIYGLYDARVANIDKYGVWMNIKGAKFQAKVDHYHVQSYQNYRLGNKVSIGDNMKIIIVSHKLRNAKRETNAIFQKYPGHELIFKFYEIYNRDLTLENIQIGGMYKGFINHIIPDKDDPSKGAIYICLKSEISGRVKVNNIKNYEIGHIVDVKVLRKSGEVLSKNFLRESKTGVDGRFEFFV